MQTTIAHLTVQTGMNSLHEVILKMIEKIESNAIYFELDARSFYLMMEEALTNAMQHGNRWDSSKAINVFLQLDEASLYIIIADEGEGFCQLALPGNSENSDKHGIRIIRKFCNPYWNDKGNAIYLKLALSDQKKRTAFANPQNTHTAAEISNANNLNYSSLNASTGPSDP